MYSYATYMSYNPFNIYFYNLAPYVGGLKVSLLPQR